MSTVIRSCPGCKSLILSDTDQCPDCGHVFYQRRRSEAEADVESLKNASLHEPCPHCGEMVRTGLVRCWSCKGFIRADVAARYRDLTSNPQPIIYSTIPIEERREYLPPRNSIAEGVAPRVFDADGFVLGSGVTSDSSAEFQLQTPVVQQTKSPVVADALPLNPVEAKSVAGPDQPSAVTNVSSITSGPAPAPELRETVQDKAPSKSEGAPKATSGAPADSGSAGAQPGEDDLLSIAMSEQREIRKRRNEKLADRQKKQMLIPCSCGAWIRVHQDQSGKSVRCRQCKQPVAVPEIRRKTEKKEEKAAVPQLDILWAEDVWFYTVNPTSLVLKPGSLVDKHVEADFGLTASGIHILSFGAPDKKKKALFGSTDKKTEREAHRKQVREQIAGSGELKNLTNAEIRTIEKERISEIRLVQPIVKVHESMFAGVPVFGEGRVALFLPVAAEDGQQAFCSLPLSAWRPVSERLKTLFGLQVPASENGVPDQDKADTLSCFVNQSKVEALRSLIYYQKDPGYELELTGYRCKACGIAVSEEGRKKNKLGGANGKGIAKAKCPKCSGKMGEDPLYRIRKSPVITSSGSSPEPAEKP